MSDIFEFFLSVIEVSRERSGTRNVCAHLNHSAHLPLPFFPSKETRMSSSGNLLKLLFTHPGDFRTLLQFKLFHERKRDLSAIHEHPTSGWDRRSMRRCWEFLDMTSRSFSAVIKELDGDLARVVSSFLPSLFRLPLSHAAPAHYRPTLAP